VALGGTSYSAITLSKNSVRSKHIVNRQVKRADIAVDAVNSSRVSDYSLRGTDFKPGELPQGPPGATNVSVRTATGFERVTAECQPGERATGGGGHSVNGFIWASAPSAHPNAIDVSTGITFQGYTPTSWTAAAEGAEPPGTPNDVTAWVVCAAP
jgi:hypothetical protein